MLVLAHSGHWAINLVYLAPFVVVAVWLIRDRRRQGGENPPGEPGEER